MARTLSEFSWRLGLDADSQCFDLVVSCQRGGGFVVKGTVRGKARGVARNVGGQVDQNGYRSIDSQDRDNHAARQLVDRIGDALKGNEQTGIIIRERGSHRAIL